MRYDSSNWHDSETLARRRRRQIALLFVVLPVGAVAILFRFTGINELLGLPTVHFVLGFMAFVAVCLGFSYLNWRCPACDAYLGEELDPPACPKCKVGLARAPTEIEWED